MRRPLITPMDELKQILTAERERSARMCDTAAKREDVKDVLLIALTAKDLEHLVTVAESMPSVRNYGVVVRRLLAQEAKRLGKGMRTMAKDK